VLITKAVNSREGRDLPHYSIKIKRKEAPLKKSMTE